MTDPRPYTKAWFALNGKKGAAARWKGKTDKEKSDHAKLMVQAREAKKRKNKPKK